MTSPYHRGELAVQARAGVLADAAHVGGIVQTTIPRQAPSFLAGERLAIIGAADARGRVWASALSGDPGMLRVVDPHTLHIAARPAAGDPLAGALFGADAPHTPTDAGVLVIDLATRRRLRLNGTAEVAADGGLLLRVRQGYWNCPKYVQRRLIYSPSNEVSPTPETPAAAPRRATTLTDDQRGWIARADTFFIASVVRDGGADASHRGGEPGFVRLARGAAGEDVLTFPDYSGNNMFNTLGNLTVHPAAGLLFIDFERGATLQLAGTAAVLWEPAQYEVWPGAERAVRFTVAESVEIAHDTSLRWRLVERSPFNPPPPGERSTTA